MLSSKLNIVSHNSIISCQIWKIPSQIWVIFLKIIILSTNNPMLSSKLNMLSHNSTISCQLWKIPSQIEVFFQDDHFEYLQLYVIFKMNILSHISVPSCQVWKIPLQIVAVFFFQDNHFEHHQPNVIFKIECFVLYLCSKWSDLKNSFTNGGCFFFETIVLSTNSPMLSSKLNISSHISVYLNIISSMST